MVKEMFVLSEVYMQSYLDIKQIAALNERHILQITELNLWLLALLSLSLCLLKT